jgi:hypothetical protein
VPYAAELLLLADTSSGDNRLTGSDEDQFYLNDYQNTFAYKTNPERTDSGLGCCSTPPAVSPSFGDPISAGLGNKYENDQLYSGTGVFPLSLTLTYNSTRAIAYTPDAKKVCGTWARNTAQDAGGSRGTARRPPSRSRPSPTRARFRIRSWQRLRRIAIGSMTG